MDQFTSLKLKYKLVKYYFPRMFETIFEYITRPTNITLAMISTTFWERYQYYCEFLNDLNNLIKQEENFKCTLKYFNQFLLTEPKPTSQPYYKFIDGYLYEKDVELMKFEKNISKESFDFVYTMALLPLTDNTFNYSLYKKVACEVIDNVIKKYDNDEDCYLKEFVEMFFVKSLKQEFSYDNLAEEILGYLNTEQ